MQDSTNREWDEQFVDHAWNEMRQTLDKELPLSRKRRRGLFLLLFILLGVMAGGLGYYWISGTDLQMHGQPDQPLLENRNKATADQSNDKDLNSDKKAAVEALVKEVSPDEIAPVTKKTSIVQNLKKGPQESLNTEPSQSVQTEKNEFENQSLVIDDPQPTLEESDRVEEKEISVIPSSKSESKEPRLAFTVFQSLEGLSIDLLDQPPLDKAIGMEALLPQNRTVKLGLELGGNYYDKPGNFGGLHLQARLAPRWRLESGFWYNHYNAALRRPSSNTSDDLAFADQSERNISNPGTAANQDPNYVANISRAALFNFDLNFQQLTLPVQLSYRLSNKWSIGAGMQLHYLLAAKRVTNNNIESFSADFSQSLTSFQQKLAGLDAADENLDQSLFRSINAGVVGALNFTPGDRLSFHLRFQQGLHNWFVEDTFEIRPSDLQLSAVYFFLK